MPLVNTTEVNEDTRGMFCLQLCPSRRSLTSVFGYDALLSPQFLQSEIPAVSHSTIPSSRRV
jgi:hypothetical protein